MKGVADKIRPRDYNRFAPTTRFENTLRNEIFCYALALALFIPASNGAAKPTTQAKFTTEKIKLDGHLDESVWASAMKAGGDMQQYEPRQGVPMTQKTEFMVVYDEDIFTSASSPTTPSPKKSWPA